MNLSFLDLLVAIADDDDHGWTFWRDIDHALEVFGEIELDDEGKEAAERLLREAQEMERRGVSRYEIDEAIINKAERICQED